MDVKKKERLNTRYIMGILRNNSDLEFQTGNYTLRYGDKKNDTFLLFTYENGKHGGGKELSVCQTRKFVRISLGNYCLMRASGL